MTLDDASPRQTTGAQLMRIHIERDFVIHDESARWFKPDGSFRPPNCLPICSIRPAYSVASTNLITAIDASLPSTSPRFGRAWRFNICTEPGAGRGD